MDLPGRGSPIFRGDRCLNVHAVLKQMKIHRLHLPAKILVTCFLTGVWKLTIIVGSAEESASSHHKQAKLSN